MYVDFREPVEKIARLNSILGKTNVIVQELKVGDYTDGENVVGVERKSPGDFCSSIKDRLFQQAEELNQTFEFPYIFIDGSLEEVILRRGGMAWTSVVGAIASLLSHYDIPVVFADIFFEELLVKTMEKHGQVIHKTYTPLRRNQKPIEPTKKDWQIYILSSFPGIGRVRATSLINHFGSLKGVLDASKEQLLEVNGIGLDTTKGLLEALI